MTRKYNGLFRKNVIDKLFDEMGQNKYIAEFFGNLHGGLYKTQIARGF